jgi:Ca2+-binding EF-hand superfamily protein
VTVEDVQEAFEQKLDLAHVDTSEILSCLALDKDLRASLESLAVEKYRQQKKAVLVFNLLDEAGKGVVVLEDLQRVSLEMLGEEIDDDELVEMIQQVDRSGDGILDKDDMIRIARQVGL